MFRVGMKVVCIKACAPWPGEPRPQRGDIFTVSRVIPPGDGYGTVLQFYEIARSRRALAEWGGDAGFRAANFRPLVSDGDKLAWARKLVEPGAKSRALVKDPAHQRAGTGG